MPSNRGTIHVDKPLSNFSLKYMNGEHIADQVAPRVSVAKESDKYFVYGRQNFRSVQSLRADKADVNFIDSWKIESTPSYTCEEYSLADLISDRERNNADAPLSPDYDSVQNLTDLLSVARELRTASILTSAATYATSGNVVTLSGVNQFDNASFSSSGVSIEKRCDTGKEAIRAAIGRDPNTIIIPAAVAKVVKRDSAVRDLIKYTQNQLLVNGDLPPTLWNMKVIIPGAVYDTAEEGQTFSGSDIWGKNIVLAYLAPNPMTPRTMTLMLTMQAQARQVTQWREDKRKSDAVEVSEILVEKLVSEYCGYLIASCIS